MPNKPRQKRERNIYGDFVVTKINIKEREVVIPKNEDEEEEEEESSEESEEEQPAEQEPEEEKKGKLIKFLYSHDSFLFNSPGESIEQEGAEETRGWRVRASHEWNGKLGCRVIERCHQWRV